MDAELLQEQRDVVRTVKEETRFIMLLMYYREIRVWMLNCYDEGMVNGEYIYFGNGFEDMIYEESDYRPEVGLHYKFGECYHGGRKMLSLSINIFLSVCSEVKQYFLIRMLCQYLSCHYSLRIQR